MKQELFNTSASLSIDFLPATYREECAQRLTQLWHMVAVAVFVSLISLAVVIQYRSKRGLEAELAELLPLHDTSVARTAKLERLQAESKALRARADLISYLRHPWPRTQILVAVLGPLPESITIGELNVTAEGIGGTQGVERRLQPRNETSKSEGEKTDPPAVADLKRLRLSRDSITLTVILSGEADDDSDLHSYLREISSHPIIQKAEVSSIEQLERDKTASSFRARVVIRNGYGQPGGPMKHDSSQEKSAEPVVKNHPEKKATKKDRA